MTIMQERPATVPEPVPEKTAEADTPQEKFLRPRRLTTDEYYHLGELGFFDNERVELLDGEIWTLPPQKTPHYAAIRRTVDALKTAFGEGCDYRQQAPMTLEDGAEPEPDVLVVPGKWEDYEGQYPKPPQVLLLVEVSDTTLRKDRTKKVTDYARAGITDYWIVNLVNRQVEVYRDPSPMPNGYGYNTTLILFEGDSIMPLSALNSAIAVADLFPPIAAQ